MGIVAFCPNGHRIKVKDEFAGRKGICPTCAARFRIPAHARAGGGMEGLPPARVLSLDAVYAASLPAARVIDDWDADGRIEEAGEPAAAVPHDAPADRSSSGGDAVAEAAGVDDSRTYAALDERPELTWCVAERGGAPSASLDTAAMRAWLDAGTASTDHVVWRSDWPEWRPLEDVFPDALSPPPPRWP